MVEAAKGANQTGNIKSYQIWLTLVDLGASLLSSVPANVQS